MINTIKKENFYIFTILVMKKIILGIVLFWLLSSTTFAYKVNDFLYFPWGNYYIWNNSDLKNLPFESNNSFDMDLYNLFYWWQFIYKDNIPKQEEILNAKYRKKLFKAIFDVIYTEHKLGKEEWEKNNSYYIEEYKTDLKLYKKELELAKLRYDDSSLALKDYNKIVSKMKPVIDLYFTEKERNTWLQLKEERMDKSMCSYFPKTWKINFNTVYWNFEWIKKYYILWINKNNSFWSPIWKDYAPAFIIQNKNDFKKIDDAKFFLQEIKKYYFSNRKVEKFKCNWSTYDLNKYNWKSCYQEQTDKNSFFINYEKELNFSLDLKKIKKDLQKMYTNSNFSINIEDKKINLNFILLWLDEDNNVIVLSTKNPSLNISLSNDSEKIEKYNIYNACKQNYDINNLFNSKWYWLQEVKYNNWQKLFKKKIDSIFDNLDKTYKLIIKERNSFSECRISDKMCWFEYNLKPTNTELILLKKYTNLLISLKNQINKYNSKIKRFDFWSWDIFDKPLKKLLTYSKKVEIRQNKLMFISYIWELVDNRLKGYLFKYLNINDLEKLEYDYIEKTN